VTNTFSPTAVVLLLAFAVATGPLAAQNETAADTAAAAAAPRPEAVPGDVESIDAIILAVYDVISGPAGQKRDWDRMRSLFIDGARLIPTGRRQNGEGGHRVMTVEDYITGSGSWLEQNGFFETEVSRKTDRFGNIAQVFTTYESRRTPDAEPFMRGINSFQLWNDGERWWVVSIFWENETAETPIPQKYLE
jgi:hypothetical protein